MAAFLGAAALCLGGVSSSMAASTDRATATMSADIGNVEINLLSGTAVTKSVDLEFGNIKPDGMSRKAFRISNESTVPAVLDMTLELGDGLPKAVNVRAYSGSSLSVSNSKPTQTGFPLPAGGEISVFVEATGPSNLDPSFQGRTGQATLKMTARAQ